MDTRDLRFKSCSINFPRNKTRIFPDEPSFHFDSVRGSVMFGRHERGQFRRLLVEKLVWLWTKSCNPQFSGVTNLPGADFFTGWYLLDPWRIALSMLLCYCWGVGGGVVVVLVRISSVGLGAARLLLRVRQTLIKLSGCFVGTGFALAVLRLTAQHLSHCAWLFGIHGAWHSFSCCWGLCGIGTDWLVGIGIVHYETKWGDGDRKKNIIRERGRWETGRAMERRVLERKSIVLNCIPNMSNLAEIRFSEKHAALGKTESLKTRSSCNGKWIHTFQWHKGKEPFL